jgi:hypothetical protein
MTNQHPLTDEVCRQIADTKDRPFTSIEMNNMRAAYDKAFEDAIECIMNSGLAHYSALYEAQENFYKLSQQLEDDND